jgi:PAS domain S-box-containing protein
LAPRAVTLTNVPRLQLVVGRELRTYRLDRALSTTLASAREAKKQLQHIVEGSTDAIALVQEGIIVDANPAWLALFGYSNPEEVVGTTLMDARPHDHAAIKGALVACMQAMVRPHAARLRTGRERPPPSLEFQLLRANSMANPASRSSCLADAGE